MGQRDDKLELVVGTAPAQRFQVTRQSGRTEKPVDLSSGVDWVKINVRDNEADEMVVDAQACTVEVAADGIVYYLFDASTELDVERLDCAYWLEVSLSGSPTEIFPTDEYPLVIKDRRAT